MVKEIIKLGQCKRQGVITPSNLLKWKTKCMQNLIRQNIQGVLTANSHQRCLLKRKRRWLRCGDLPLKILLR